MNERVAIYARVSTDEQADKQTIENQLVACREYCVARGLEVAAEFRDDGVSGSIPVDERSEGRRLLEVAGDGLFQHVVVYRLDRLARDVPEAILAYRRLKALGTPVISASESWDDSPSGKLVFNLFVSIAEFERDIIRERTMAGRRRRVRSGKYQAPRPPYGYIYDRNAGVLKPDPEQAGIVRQMFEWACEGLGLQAIAVRLNEANVGPPNGTRPSRWNWHFSTIHRILGAPRYMGCGSYGGEPMVYPRLIDEETFAAAQNALRRRRLDSHRNTKHVYLLQHLIWCRHCGARYAVKTSRKHRYYRCYRRSVYGAKAAGHQGVKWSWRAEELEMLVKRHVVGIWVDPEHMLREAEIYMERAQRDIREREQRMSALQDRLNRLVREERKVLEWARKDMITDEQMRQQLDEVCAQRHEAQTELEALRQHPTGGAEWASWWATSVRQSAKVFQWVREVIPEAQCMDDSWTDDVLAGEMMAHPAIEAAWPHTMRELIDRIWVEDDGSITIEGRFPGHPALQRGPSESLPSG